MLGSPILCLISQNLGKYEQLRSFSKNTVYMAYASSPSHALSKQIQVAMTLEAVLVLLYSRISGTWQESQIALSQARQIE